MNCYMSCFIADCRNVIQVLNLDLLHRFHRFALFVRRLPTDFHDGMTPMMSLHSIHGHAHDQTTLFCTLHALPTWKVAHLQQA